MVAAVNRRLRLKIVVCAFVGIAVLTLSSWFGWCWYRYTEEGHIIASLESQGAQVQQEKSDSFCGKAASVWHGPRNVSLLVVGRHVDMNLARQLPGLSAIHFQSTVIPEAPQISITDEDIRAISGMGQLETLTMTRVKAAPSLWSVLQRLTKLKWLIVEDVPLEDDGVAAIGKVRGLTRLHLDNCAVTDEGLTHLRGLPELQELGLRQSHISAAGLRQLKDLPKLTTLDLAKCKLTDDSLDALVACTSLRNLDVSDNPISDKGLEILSRIRNLGFIQLKNTKITDAGLRVFAQQTNNGRSLNVKGTSVTQAGVAELLTANPLMVVQDVSSSPNANQSSPDSRDAPGP